MIITREDVDRFHEFARLQVGGENSELTWRQLFELWRLENPSDEESEENIVAIQESLDAMDAGRMRSFSEFDAQFRARHRITEDA